MFARLRTGSDQHKPFLLIEGKIIERSPPQHTGEVFREREEDRTPLCRRYTKRDQTPGGGANPQRTKWDYRVPSGMRLFLS